MASWEYKLEEFGIFAAIAAIAIPATLPKVHHDESEQAASERLIFFAVTGSENPAGAQVFDTTLEIELRTTNRDAAAVDAMFASIEAAFALPEVINSAQSLFPGGLWYSQEESSNAREDSRDTRRRSRTYNFSVAHV